MGGRDVLESSHFPVLLFSSLLFSSLLWTTIAAAQPVFTEDFELTNSYKYVSPVFNTSLPPWQWPLWPEGTYTITHNPNAVHSSFASFGDRSHPGGRMYVVNGKANTVVWARTIRGLTPFHGYTLRLWAASAYPESPAQLQVSAAGTAPGSPVTLPTATGQWVAIDYTFYAAANQTAAYVEIKDINSAPGGNDFTIDDITIFDFTSQRYLLREDFEVFSDYSYVDPTVAPNTPNYLYPLWPERTYTITSNPQSVHLSFSSFGDHTGSGKMMVANGAANTTVWSRTMSGLTPNQGYVVSVWAASVYPASPAILRWSGGNTTGASVALPSSPGQWVQVAMSFMAQTQEATLQLTDINGEPGGNDFALDDIVLQESGVTISQLVATPQISSASINWTTSGNATTMVRYGTTPSYGSQVSNGTQSISHSAFLPSLSSGTVYYFEASSTNSVGVSTSRTGKFRTSDLIPQRSGSSNTSSALGNRWEVTTAAAVDSVTGTERWLQGWWDRSHGLSYLARWTGSAWVEQLGPDPSYQLFDLNLTWDPLNRRFAYVGGDVNGDIWYGYSTSADGAQWTVRFKVLSRAERPTGFVEDPQRPFNFWDYPSIGISAQGKVTIGAVGFNRDTSTFVDTPLGYFVSTFDAAGPSSTVQAAAIVGTVGQGPGGRVIANGSSFQTFVPFLSNGLPTRVDRWHGSVNGSGTSWSGPFPVASFEAPRASNLRANEPLPPNFREVFYAPVQLAAQGDDAGRWAVAFQVNWEELGKDWNTAMICSSDRGCGVPFQGPQDQFLVSVGISSGPAYWLSYLSQREDSNVDVEAWFIAPGQWPAGAAVEQGVVTSNWSLIARCPSLCRAAGDYMTMAALSNLASKASVPFIQSNPSGNNNFVKQSFLVAGLFAGDQPLAPSAQVAAPPSAWPTFPLGTNFRGRGKPHGAARPNPALRIRSR